MLKQTKYWEKNQIEDNFENGSYENNNYDFAGIGAAGDDCYNDGDDD